MYGMGFGEITVVLLIALVVLGPKELPHYFRNAGQFARAVRDWFRSIESDSALMGSAFAALAVMTIYLIGLMIRFR